MLETIVLGAVAVLILVAIAIVICALAYAPMPDRPKLNRRAGARTLVVLVHGLPGRTAFEPAVALAKDVLPSADFLVPSFKSGPLSNSDPYRITNTVERAIHEAHEANAYASIVLVGYSIGAVILRKALVWGHGLEDDRTGFGKQGERGWVKRVDRLVSLAGINRGWSLDKRPKHMNVTKFVGGRILERLARLTRTGKMLLSVRRGAPFIADLRVQWIRLARGSQGKLPLAIQLVGDIDDVVSHEDSNDLSASKDTVFITLRNTGHMAIGHALRNRNPRDASEAERVAKIRHVLVGPRSELKSDLVEPLKEDLEVHRIIYVMHGIRDFGKWGDDLKKAITVSAPKERGLRVVPMKYGRFPMGPFLLYWDRQRNVRLFMDQFTENLAQFPLADRFDFVGHSNGTYILASALQHYKTLKAGNVFFAGSVVPRHYDWMSLIKSGRVEKVVNVAASNDWVVAIFPRFFEQIAEWRGKRPMTGLLDIGSAGFRGFIDGSDANNRVQNLMFVPGQHGAAIDFHYRKRLTAVVEYAVNGESAAFDAFEEVKREPWWMDLMSNLSPVVWLLLAAILFWVGYSISAAGWWWTVAYLVVLLVVLTLF